MEWFTSCDISTILSIIMLIAAVFAFIDVNSLPAPYGRHVTATKFSVDPKLSWFLQESPSFFVPVYFLFSYLFSNSSHSEPANIVGVILLTMFAVHYFNRFMIYPFKTESVNRVPLRITLLAFIFCSYNGYMQSKYILGNHYSRFLIFCIGMYLNIKSDSHLINARKSLGPGVYVIPRGGLFEFVSCANYFSEIVEWFGFALACLSLPSLAFFIFTICNLAPRAKSHHSWYLKRFEDYPRNRKILVPYIW